MALINGGSFTRGRQRCSFCHALILPHPDDSTIAKSFINSSWGPALNTNNIWLRFATGMLRAPWTSAFSVPSQYVLQAWAVSMQSWWNGDISFNIRSIVWCDVFNPDCAWFLSWHTGTIDCGFVSFSVTLKQKCFQHTWTYKRRAHSMTSKWM